MASENEDLARHSHWADQAAAEILRTRSGPHIVATGITPSGPIHLGNLREVLTADAVYRSLIRQGAQASLIYMADTFDPLRRVYPFLPDHYEEHVGKPLFAIPDPEGCCESYAEHYLRPFLRALEEMGIRPTVYRAHELYGKGVYGEVAKEAVRKREAIAAILREVSGRELPKDWFPFNPICSTCGRISETKVVSVSDDGETAEYICSSGHRGWAAVGTGDGKLPWRIDWPARWKALGVTVEPFGKDHAAAGGSYDTGSLLSRDIFGYEPPHPIIYEWIYLKGKGAMASSTGVAISVNELLEMMAPEVVRFIVVRSKPEKHIEFDPQNGIIQIMEDYQEIERSYYSTEGPDVWSARVYELAQVDKPPPEMPLQVPLTHLAIASQTSAGNVEGALKILERTGYPVAEEAVQYNESMKQLPLLKGTAPNRRQEATRQLARADVWVERFAPAAFRFEISSELPPAAQELSERQQEFLSSLANILEATEWEAGAIHVATHGEGKRMGLSPKEAFSALYLALVGKAHGPRAGYFLSSLDKEFVVGRLREAGQTTAKLRKLTTSP